MCKRGTTKEETAERRRESLNPMLSALGRRSHDDRQTAVISGVSRMTRGSTSFGRYGADEQGLAFRLVAEDGTVIQSSISGGAPGIGSLACILSRIDELFALTVSSSLLHTW